MVANRFIDPFVQKFAASTGAVGAGYKLYFYQAGSTTTLQDTYSDVSLSSANANPVVADGNGLFGDIFLNSSLDYACKLTDASDNQIDYADNIQPSTLSTTNNILQEETVLGSAASGQVLTLTQFTYTPGANGNLLVFLNGHKLEKGVSNDYTETSTSTITMNSAITISPTDKFIFVKNLTTTSITGDASGVTYTGAGVGAVVTNVQSELRKCSQFLLSDTTSQSTTGTAEEVLVSHSIPANTLRVDGRGIRIKAWGTTAATANSKRIRIRFGGLSSTVIADTTSQAANNKVWIVDALILRVNANTQKCVGTSIHNDSEQPPLATSDSEDLTTLIPLVVTGETPSASGDLTYSGSLVELI